MSKQAENYKNQGNEAFKAGDYAKALELYTFATEVDPNNNIFFQNRAMAYFKLGKFDKSLRDSERALKIAPKSLKAHFRKAESLYNLQQYQESLDAYKLGADLFPEENLFSDGMVKAKTGLFAGKSQAEILKMDGNDAFKKGDMPGAVKLYTSAINKADMKSEEGKILAADIYANRAAVNRQLYHPDLVIEDCTEALKLVPNHVKALIRRGQAYESIEKYEKALEDFETASRLGGGVIATQGASRCRKAVRSTGKHTTRQ